MKTEKPFIEVWWDAKRGCWTTNVAFKIGAILKRDAMEIARILAKNINKILNENRKTTH